MPHNVVTLEDFSQNLLPKYSWQIYTFNGIEEKIVDTD
jgi:hypothetical protein